MIKGKENGGLTTRSSSACSMDQQLAETSSLRIGAWRSGSLAEEGHTPPDHELSATLSGLTPRIGVHEILHIRHGTGTASVLVLLAK